MEIEERIKEREKWLRENPAHPDFQTMWKDTYTLKKKRNDRATTQ